MAANNFRILGKLQAILQFQRRISSAFQFSFFSHSYHGLPRYVYSRTVSTATESFLIPSRSAVMIRVVSIGVKYATFTHSFRPFSIREWANERVYPLSVIPSANGPVTLNTRGNGADGDWNSCKSQYCLERRYILLRPIFLLQEITGYVSNYVSLFYLYILISLIYKK